MIISARRLTLSFIHGSSDLSPRLPHLDDNPGIGRPRDYQRHIEVDDPGNGDVGRLQRLVVATDGTAGCGRTGRVGRCPNDVRDVGRHVVNPDEGDDADTDW